MSVPVLIRLIVVLSGSLNFAIMIKVFTNIKTIADINKNRGRNKKVYSGGLLRRCAPRNDRAIT
jgi:hypothetical protein